MKNEKMKDLFFQYDGKELDKFVNDAHDAIMDACAAGIHGRTGRVRVVHVANVPTQEEIKGRMLLGFPIEAGSDEDYYNPCTGTDAVWVESNGMHLHVFEYDTVCKSVEMPKPAKPVLHGALHHTFQQIDANGNILNHSDKILCTKERENIACYDLVSDIAEMLRDWRKSHADSACSKCPLGVEACSPYEDELATMIFNGEPFTVPDKCRTFGKEHDKGWHFAEGDDGNLVFTHPDENGGMLVHTYSLEDSPVE